MSTTQRSSTIRPKKRNRQDVDNPNEFTWAFYPKEKPQLETKIRSLDVNWFNFKEQMSVVSTSPRKRYAIIVPNARYKSSKYCKVSASFHPEPSIFFKLKSSGKVF